MCLICIEFTLGRLTNAEARMNLLEMKSSVGEEHYKYAKEMLVQQQMKEIEEMSKKDFLREFGKIIAEGSD